MDAQTHDQYMQADFAREHGLTVIDVQAMGGLGMVEFADTLAGRQILFAQGYTSSQAKATYSVLQRAQSGRVIASRSIAWPHLQLV